MTRYLKWHVSGYELHDNENLPDNTLHTAETFSFRWKPIRDGYDRDGEFIELVENKKTCTVHLSRNVHSDGSVRFSILADAR